MVRDLDPKEAKERPREAQAHEPHLPSVGVPRQHEIAFALGEMPERARIVEEHDSGHSGPSRVPQADALHVGFSIAPDEIHSHDLDRTRTGIDDPLVVDQENDAIGGERPGDDLRRHVVVIAVTGEHLAGHGAKRLEGAP